MPKFFGHIFLNVFVKYYKRICFVREKYYVVESNGG